jgi:SAM-dependent methyltransferase
VVDVMRSDAPSAIPTAEIAATYDALAPRWDAQFAGRPDPRSEWVRRIERFVGPREPVAELGCATGVPVGWLLADRYRYIGVDVSRRMIERAGELLPSAAFTCADATTLRFPAESLGAVVALGLFPNVDRDRHADLLVELGRWIRPGGVFVGSLTALDVPTRTSADWLGAGPMQWSGFDAATNSGLLDAAGFDVLEEVVRGPEPTDGDEPTVWYLARRNR